MTQKGPSLMGQKMTQKGPSPLGQNGEQNEKNR